MPCAFHHAVNDIAVLPGVTGMFWGLDEILLFLAAIAAFLAVIEICFRLGRRHNDPSDDTVKSHFSALQAALLGLLALLLGFNFAMAASRFEVRKSLLEEEVNAIRLAYLRAQLLPPPYQQEVMELLRAYGAARIEFLRAGIDQSLLDAANADASRIEAQLWASTRAMMAQDPTGATKQMLIQSLNDMISANEKRRAALENHVPEVVLYLLFVVAVGAIGFIAYGYGLTRRRRHGSTAIFALLIALVLTIIVDMDQPRTGVIRVGEDSMLRLKADLEQKTP
jgi:hypothetical protein